MKDKLLSTPADFFVFRTPLLPFDEFLKWSDALQAASALNDPITFGRAYAEDCRRLRDRLHTLFKRPDVWEALFVAAPNLTERFHLWTDAPESKRGRKIEQVLVRYLTRMTARATPFGLCAGFSVGRTGPETRLTIEGRETYRRHTRLDMSFLVALTEAWSCNPELQKIFIYRPNSSLYRAAGGLRYVESRLEGHVRSFHLVAVEDDDHLNETLNLAGQGATLSSLAAALVSDEVSQDEAEEYIAELIDNQLLVPDIALPLTGQEPIPPLLEQLGNILEAKESTDKLYQANSQLIEIDKAGVGVDPARYRSVARGLEGLPARIDPARLFEVDLIKPAPEAVLGKAVLDEIKYGVHLLHQLSRHQRSGPLTRFRQKFIARYETKEVSLVEALDEEVGVGFEAGEETSPLLKDLLFPSADSEQKEVDGARQKLLLRKLHETFQQGLSEITFDSNELKALSSKDSPPLPDSFAVSAILAASSEAALATGDFKVFVSGCVGPSGAALLGRFCHLDEVLQQYVRNYLRKEEALQPDAIFAEIVHLPEGHIGNVVLRPVLRDFEITYLGCSGATIERQVPITDLSVSIREGRVHLRSARLGRAVIPRMTNAHNYFQRGVGLYRFLCMLQQEGVAGRVGWSWGGLVHAPYLPRVSVGRLVLSLARWNMNKEELLMLGASQGGAAGFRDVQVWRAERRLPRLVNLVDNESALLVDLNNALSVESFIHLVKEREDAVLEELFPGADQHCARGPEGRFVQELIVPFVCGKSGVEKTEDRAESVSERHLEPGASPAFCRRFPPGSEWLYAKLYSGTATSDQLLRRLVQPLVEKLLQSGAADGWFFIRYADPDPHLRLRVHGLPERLLKEFQPMLYEAVTPLLDKGLLWRVQFDTYEREVERYGGAEGMLLAEQLFQVDSEAVLRIIEMLETGDQGMDERWRLTLCGIDMLLTDFGLKVDAKRKLLKHARTNLLREYDLGSDFVRQLAGKFRKERRSLELLLSARPETDHQLSPGLEVLHQRSNQLTSIVKALKELDREKHLSIPLPKLLISYTHMHSNRLLRSASRQQELVIYDFLVHLYDSRIARAHDS